MLPSYVNLTRQGLHYRDLLTYITIRSYNNTTWDICKPSYVTISRTSGMSKKYICGSVKRLKASGILKVNSSSKKRVANEYSFPQCHAFSRIPYSILDDTELTTNEKAMLIAVRQFFLNNLEHMGFSIKEMAEVLDITYQSFAKQYNSLIKKGYIEQFTKPGRTKPTSRLTDKIQWPCDDSKQSVKEELPPFRLMIG